MAIQGLVQLIIYLILGGIVVYIVYWIVGMLTLPQPIKTAICLLVALIVLLWLLATMGVIPKTFLLSYSGIAPGLWLK